MRSAVLAALATFLVGCFPSMGGGHLAVGPASPRPNVVVAADRVPATLVLAPSVADEFVIPETGSVHQVPVRGWRHTLEAGFASAFPQSSTGRTLEIADTELTFAPAAVGMGGTAAVVATVRFKARLLDASGKELAVLAGTVHAREADVSPTEAGMTDNAAKAVEALYEALTANLLSRP